MDSVLFSHNSEEWSTPDSLFKILDSEFHFELDPCASDVNHKCDIYYTKLSDGLKSSWFNYRVFCNPPYGRCIKDWVYKSFLHCNVVVMLLPVRTDTNWFHKYIYNNTNVEIRFIKGRLKFGGSFNNAPFPSMIVIFNNLLYEKS